MATCCVGTGVCKGIEEIPYVYRSHQVCVVDTSAFPRQNLGGIQAWRGSHKKRRVGLLVLSEKTSPSLLRKYHVCSCGFCAVEGTVYITHIRSSLPFLAFAIQDYLQLGNVPSPHAILSPV